VLVVGNKNSYVNMWGLTIGLSWLLGINIFYVDLLLVFLLYSIFLPLILYKLGQWFEQNPGYKIGRVYGSSIGTVNGSIFLDDYKKLYNFWNEIKSFKSMVDYWCKIPFIGPIISIINGFFFKVNFYEKKMQVFLNKPVFLIK
jgi:hypothetical protein